MTSTYEQDIAELTEMQSRYVEHTKAYRHIGALLHYIKQLRNEKDFFSTIATAPFDGSADVRENHNKPK